MVNDFYSYECYSSYNVGQGILHTGNRKSVSIFFNLSSFFRQPELNSGLCSEVVPDSMLFLFSIVLVTKHLNVKMVLLALLKFCSIILVGEI